MHSFIYQINNKISWWAKQLQHQIRRQHLASCDNIHKYIWSNTRLRVVPIFPQG